MQHLTCIKEVQRLVKQEVTLSKFILYFTDKYVEAFKILKNHKSFKQIAKCAKAF